MAGGHVRTAIQGAAVVAMLRRQGQEATDE